MGAEMAETELDPIPQDAVSFVLRSLTSDPEGAAAFIDGLSKHLHFLSVDPSAVTQAQLLRFVREWVQDVAVSRGSSWRESVEANEAAIDRGEVTDTATSGELRALLKL